MNREKISLKRKIVGEVEIRATLGEVLHDMLKQRPHDASNVVPHFLHGVDLHDGQHGLIGSTSTWKATVDGKPLVAKTILEEINEENKLVRYRIIEGDLMDKYNTMTAQCQVIPKDTETSIAVWTFEYEKLHPGIPEPSGLLESWIAASIDIDDHHHGVKKN